MASYTIRMADSVRKRTPSYTVKWAYDYGVLLKGMAAVWQKTKDGKYFQYVKDGMDYFIGEDGSIRFYQPDAYSLDNINNGKILLWLYRETGDERYRKAADLLWAQLQEQPRTSEGAFWHKKCYPSQIWLDGLYMASPFYAEYAQMFGKPEAVEDVVRQFRVCEKHLRDAKTGLLYHAWDESRTQFWCDPKTGLSRNFWGRSMGWYIMALADALDYIPEGSGARPELIGYFRSAAEALLKVRDRASGVWYQVLDQGSRKGNYREASVSCMVCYAVEKGARKGYLPAEYRSLAGEIFRDITKEFLQETPDGLLNLNRVCRVAGLGGKDRRDGSYGYYIGEPTAANDFKGVGPFLMAGAEIE